MKFLDIFNEINKGNYALTEEAIYYSIQKKDMIPLWGGNSNHNEVERKVYKNAKTRTGQQIKNFTGEGIIISLDGSAGSMTYKKDDIFALNHHAGFITVRDDRKNEINLEFFSLFYQNFYKSLAVSEGSKTLSLARIYTAELEIPPINLQNSIMNKIKQNQDIIEKLIKLRHKIEDILEMEITTDYTSYQARDISISKVVGYMSGNTGLTEEAIYQAMQHKGIRYKVLSSSTEESTMLGEIPMCEINGKQIKVFSDKEGLLVTRNGKAGRTRFLERGDYTINDHAYILFVKDDCSYDIDLRWLEIKYRSEFLSYSSNSENGTWNMTGFFKFTTIDIPTKKEQLQLVTLWNKAELLRTRIEKLQLKLDELLDKEIAIED